MTLLSFSLSHIVLLFIISCHLVNSAPSCDPNSFCYSPSDTVKITVRKTGNLLDLKFWSQNEKVGNVYLYQNEGKEVKMSCDLETNKIELSNGAVVKNGGIEANDQGVVCHSNIEIDHFNKTNQFYVKMDNSPPSQGFQLESLSPPISEGLTKDQRRQFSKAHAILMLLGWLFFVPTGFLFVRLGKDIFKDQTLFGGAVWFQIHRASNFMGVVCICASMLCIYISQQWTWKGTGSGSKYWTEVHTDLGVISSILAVAQPINSLFRCGPTHSNRIIFNWAHRIVGIAAYTLAITTIIIAAINFKKIWNEPLLELVLLSLPILICIGASVGFPLLENERFRNKTAYGKNNRRSGIRLSPLKNSDRDVDKDDDDEPLVRDHQNSSDSEADTDSVSYDENAKPRPTTSLWGASLTTPHLLRIPVIFWAIGVFFASAVALSLLVVNGYKN